MSDIFVQLKDNGDNLYPKSKLITMDLNNVLVEGYHEHLVWVATEDCIVTCSNWIDTQKINGIDLGYLGANSITFLHKGDTFECRGYINKIYGCKYYHS